LLATHQARPLAEVLRGMNKRSDNPLTRLVYLSLGVDAPNAASFERSVDASASVVRAWFKSHGIDDAGLVLDNGSGLSRSERISPAQMAALLRAAYAGNYAPELLTSLPIVGVDGTMGRRLKNSPAAGRARIKTGTLKNVVAVAGYVPDAGGRWWVVVATINHDQARQGRPVLDAVIDWVARQR
jgi:D-alanyl-D-alanine carboxypeptidase/D-alanyl-D-alanine-endopeptidase (penicillin-binding protein 4)